MSSRFDTIPERDRQTNGRTDRVAIGADPEGRGGGGARAPPPKKALSI